MARCNFFRLDINVHSNSASATFFLSLEIDARYNSEGVNIFQVPPPPSWIWASVALIMNMQLNWVLGKSLSHEFSQISHKELTLKIFMVLLPLSWICKRSTTSLNIDCGFVWIQSLVRVFLSAICVQIHDGSLSIRSATEHNLSQFPAVLHPIVHHLTLT